MIPPSGARSHAAAPASASVAARRGICPRHITLTAVVSAFRRGQRGGLGSHPGGALCAGLAGLIRFGRASSSWGGLRPASFVQIATQSGMGRWHGRCTDLRPAISGR